MAADDVRIDIHTSHDTDPDADLALLRQAIAQAPRPEVDAWREIRSRRHAARRGLSQQPGHRATGVTEDTDAADGVSAEDATRLRELLDARERGDRPEAEFHVDIHDGLTVVGLPYDYGHHYQTPNTRPPVESVGDPAGGLMQIAGDSSAGDDPVSSVAGVGFVMRSAVAGIVQIRPRITYTWHYSNLANGLFAYAESEGGAELAVWRQRDGALVSSEGVRRVQLFRNHVSPGEFRDDSEDGVVTVADIQVEVPVDSGEGYWVNLGAWVMCDHNAGVTVAPTTSAYGKIASHAEFVVIQRFT